jgi:hypothetical protein
MPWLADTNILADFRRYAEVTAVHPQDVVPPAAGPAG